MDTLTIILLTVGLGAFVALVWMSGYELGHASGSDAERALANRRINGVLDSINKSKPRKAVKRRAAK